MKNKMQKQIVKTFLILGVFLMLPSFAIAATGDVLALCTFDESGVIPSQVITNCGSGWGRDVNIDTVANIVSEGHDGKKAISYYYPNTYDPNNPSNSEIVDTFWTPNLNKQELTIDYWEKFDVNADGSSLWNVKSIRPYVGSGGNDYMAAMMSRHNGGSWYQSRWGGVANLTTTNLVSYVVNGTGYCAGGDQSYTCGSTPPDDGRLEVRPVQSWGTSWHNVRVYIKVPSNDAATDGVTKVWVDGALLYTLINISKSPNWSAGWHPYTTYVTFHPSDDFFQGTNSSWVSQRFPFHHLYDDITVYDGLVSPDGDSSDTTAPTTTASPTSSTFSSAQNIVLSANEAATIYYTTNGSTPTTSSTTYSAPINIPATTTLKYFAKDSAGNSENPKTQIYTINTASDTEAPTTPANLSGVAASSTSIQLTWDASTDNVGVVDYLIQMLPDHYAVSTTNSKLWTYTITPGVEYSFRVWARDAADNYSTPTDYAITTTSSDTTAPTTTASPTGDTFTSAQNITLSANEPATIYYTTNGTTPTTSSTVYSSPINISATTTLKYFAKDTAGNSETPKTQTYTINIPTTYSISNLLMLVTNWLKSGTVSDVNSDNVVNTRDLGIMMSKWN